MSTQELTLFDAVTAIAPEPKELFDPRRVEQDTMNVLVKLLHQHAPKDLAAELNMELDLVIDLVHAHLFAGPRDRWEDLTRLHVEAELACKGLPQRFANEFTLDRIADSIKQLAVRATRATRKSLLEDERLPVAGNLLNDARPNDAYPIPSGMPEDVAKNAGKLISYLETFPVDQRRGELERFVRRSPETFTRTIRAIVIPDQSFHRRLIARLQMPNVEHFVLRFTGGVAPNRATSVNVEGAAAAVHAFARVNVWRSQAVNAAEKIADHAIAGTFDEISDEELIDLLTHARFLDAGRLTQPLIKAREFGVDSQFRRSVMLWGRMIDQQRRAAIKRSAVTGRVESAELLPRCVADMQPSQVEALLQWLFPADDPEAISRKETQLWELVRAKFPDAGRDEDQLRPLVRAAATYADRGGEQALLAALANRGELILWDEPVRQLLRAAAKGA